MFLREKEEAFQRGRRYLSSPLLISLLLAVVTLAVFWPARTGEFLSFDDHVYFASNRRVLGGLTGDNILWAFTTFESANWHPLTWLSLMLDAELFGDGPAGPHLTNLVLHALNAVLVFLLLRQMTGRLWPGAAVAALFALHPLRVESVAWIAERKDVLSAFFGLLALFFYARYAAAAKSANAKGKSAYGWSLFFFALGLMAKPMLVTWPFVMLLLDFWPLQRFSAATCRRLFVEKIPFVLLTAASCAFTFLAQKNGGAVVTLTQFTMVERVENAFLSYARYLGKTFWPFSLATPYSHPVGIATWPLTLSIILFVACCVAAIYFRKSLPFVGVGWFWFAGTLIPVIGLVQVGGAALADRYTYIPSIGIFIILVWGARKILDRATFLRPTLILLLATCPDRFVGANQKPDRFLAERRDAIFAFAGRDPK